MLYFWLSLLFIASCLGLGLLISTRATTQRQAQQLSLLVTMFSLLLGGMIYPRAAMPPMPRFIGDLLPMTYFVRISRGIFTKGVGFQFLWTRCAGAGHLRRGGHPDCRPEFQEAIGLATRCVKATFDERPGNYSARADQTIQSAARHGHGRRQNCHLQVAAGETYGLIGPDGAGKTTTTRVILGLLTRTAGESTILGFDSMHDTYAIRERVGYIAQQNVLPADLTVMENMRFFAGIQCVSQQDQKRRIPELLEFAGLSDFTDRLAGRLSGGMKKKLALACSLIHEPQVVMLDEPTLGVDPVSRREFWNLLGNLRAEKGLTIFVCTPYMDEAERCTRIGLIYAGKLIASGTPAQIKAMVPGRLIEFTPSMIAPAQELLPAWRACWRCRPTARGCTSSSTTHQLRKPQIDRGLGCRRHCA